jgi:hypothetical protein
MAENIELRRAEIKKYLTELLNNFNLTNTFNTITETEKNNVKQNTTQLFQDITNLLEDTYMLLLLDTVFMAGALAGADQAAAAAAAAAANPNPTTPTPAGEVPR